MVFWGNGQVHGRRREDAVKELSVSSESLNLSKQGACDEVSFNPRPLLLLLTVSLAAVALELGLCNASVRSRLCLLLVLAFVLRGCAAASPPGSSQGIQGGGDDFQPLGLPEHQTYPRTDVASLAWFPCKMASLNTALNRTVAPNGAHGPPGVHLPVCGLRDVQFWEGSSPSKEDRCRCCCLRFPGLTPLLR